MQTFGTFSSTCVNTKLKFSWQGSQKSCNLKNQDFSVLPEPTWLPGGDGGRSQRRYKFRLVGSTAPSNTFIANKSITIPPGTLDPSSRSPCRRLTHFRLTQVPKVPFLAQNRENCSIWAASGKRKPPRHGFIIGFRKQPGLLPSSCSHLTQSIQHCHLQLEDIRRLIGGREEAFVV